MTRLHARTLSLQLDPAAQEPLYTQLYAQIRDAVVGSAVQPGDRLPSVRELAADLRVSHTTVERAYLQLSVEGFVDAVPRSGYVVNDVNVGYLAQAVPSSQVPASIYVPDAPYDDLWYRSNQGSLVPYDFSFTDLRAGSFPAKLWSRLTNDVLFSGTCDALERYPHYDRQTAFEAAMAAYLLKARGVRCVPQQVIAQPGTEAALESLLGVFAGKPCVVGAEEPGYGAIREAARRCGLPVAPLPTDCGGAAFIEAVRRLNPQVVFCTPSHQYPTGSVLSLEHRIELLEWAATTDAYILEDDSCSEYRYETSPIPSLASLDRHERVVYLGNFSKTLSPSLRVAYMVLPPALLERYYTRLGRFIPQVSLLTLEVLGRFVEEGYWEQHVHRMVTAARTCHDLLLQNLREHLGAMVRIGGIDSGIHFYVTVLNGMDQEQLVKRAFEQGVNVYPTRRYWFSQPAPSNTLMVGFSLIAPSDIPEGVRLLKQAWM